MKSVLSLRTLINPFGFNYIWTWVILIYSKFTVNIFQFVFSNILCKVKYSLFLQYYLIIISFFFNTSNQYSFNYFSQFDFRTIPCQLAWGCCSTPFNLNVITTGHTYKCEIDKESEVEVYQIQSQNYSNSTTSDQTIRVGSSIVRPPRTLS